MNEDQNTNVNDLTSEKESKDASTEMIQEESDTPLFLQDSSDGHKGNAQDEKDKTGE